MQPIPGFPTSFNPDVSTQLGMSQNGPDEAVLYVGNLSNLVTDAILHQHFQNYGKVASTYRRLPTWPSRRIPTPESPEVLLL
jgi:RNA recognition motif-containing protein